MGISCHSLLAQGSDLMSHHPSWELPWDHPDKFAGIDQPEMAPQPKLKPKPAAAAEPSDGTTHVFLISVLKQGRAHLPFHCWNCLEQALPILHLLGTIYLRVSHVLNPLVLHPVTAALPLLSGLAPSRRKLLQRLRKLLQRLRLLSGRLQKPKMHLPRSGRRLNHQAHSHLKRQQ